MKLPSGRLSKRLIDRWVGTLNLFFERQSAAKRFGNHVRLRRQGEVPAAPQFEPAVEVFGEPGHVNRFGFVQ